MADDTVTDDPAKASQDELRRRREEQARRAQQQPQAGAQPQPQISGFGLSAEASERQRKKREQEEAARRQQQQREYDDIFLKTLAKIYGLPPQPESFKQEFVPILMACTVLQSTPDGMVGKFAGARELPPVKIARDHVIAQGGQMTPELAMHLAMLAASNPDMQREGVEIQGATEEDKLMLYAAAQLLGLKVLNPPQIDNEQKQAQRVEACKLGWQNLHQWAQPGQAPAQAPQPAAGSKADDDEQSAQPQPKPRPGSDVPPVIPVPTPAATPSADADKKPPPGNAPDGKTPDYDDLDDEQKDALRTFFKAATGANLPDEQIDEQMRDGWNSQPDDKRKAILAQAEAVQKRMKEQAEAAAAPEPLTPPPPPSPPSAPELKPVGQRVYKDLLPAEKKLLQEDELTKQNKPGNGGNGGGGEAEAPAKTKLSKQEQKELADRWDGMSEEDRTKLYDDAGKLEAELAEKAEKARQAKLRKLAKKNAAAFEKQKQDHAAQAALFDAALAASDSAAPREAPALKAVEDRKFAELLPAEQLLLLEDEMTRLKKNSLTDGEKKALADKWDGMDAEARKAHFAEAGAKELTLTDAVDEERKAAVKSLADAAARAEAAKPQPAPLRTWEELDEADREEIREFVRREKRMKKAGDEYTEDEIKGPWGRMPDGETQNEALESIKQANIKARAAAAKNEPPVPNADADAPVVPETGEEKPDAENQSPPAPAAGSPVAPPKPDEKPRRSFGQVVRDLLSSVWQAIRPVFIRAPKPVAEAGQAEPVAETLPEAPPASGVDEVSKKKFNDLLPQEQRALLIDNASNGGHADSFPAKWDALDESGKAALFNQAMNNNPILREAVIAEQAAGRQQPVPAQNLEPAPFEQTPVEGAPAEPVAKKTVAAETPNLIRDAGERQWNELLDAEKEAAQIYFDGADPESGWNGASAADRNTAIQLGIETKPELAAKIEAARKAENERLVVATTPPASNIARVKQQSDIIATTPPLSNKARVEQKDNLAAVTPTPVVAENEAEKEVPKDDPALEGALKARGLTRDALLGMPPDQRKGILAEIKKEQETEQTPPVVDVRRDDPPASPVVQPESMTVTFNNISVDNIHQLPPSADARRVIQNTSLPKSIDKDKLLEAYQQIRANVVRQGASNPGFRVTRAFLGNAADANHLKDLLGHKGLRPEEANAILACLKAEGVTVQKSAHAEVRAANDWQTRLASHYKPEM